MVKVLININYLFNLYHCVIEATNLVDKVC